MTRSAFFELLKIPLTENSSDTELTVGDIDSYHNLHQKEWFQLVDSMGLFMSRFPNLPLITLSTTVDTNSYKYLNASKFSADSTTGSASASGGVTTITDSAHATFLSTDNVAPGDRVYYSSTYYDIIQATETTLKIADANGAVSGTITYNIRSRPLFPVFAQYRKGTSSADYWHKMERATGLRGRNDQVEWLERHQQYVTNGEYIEVFPNTNYAGQIRIYYAPYPVPFSSAVADMTNPFGFEDDVTEAYAYFLASKYFDDKPGDYTKFVEKNMKRAFDKLQMVKGAGQVAWGSR